MRFLAVFAVVFSGSLLVVWLLGDAEWECRIRYSSPKTLSSAGQAIAVEGGGVITEGTLVEANSMSLGDGRLRAPMLSTNISSHDLSFRREP